MKIKVIPKIKRAVLIKNKSFNKNIENVPTGMVGLYYFYENEELVYIGRAVCVRGRLQHHFSVKGIIAQRQIDPARITKILAIDGNYDDEIEEIKKYRPKWNVDYNEKYFNEDIELCMECSKRHHYNFECEEKKQIVPRLLEKMREGARRYEREQEEKRKKRKGILNKITQAMKCWF